MPPKIKWHVGIRPGTGQPPNILATFELMTLPSTRVLQTTLKTNGYMADVHEKRTISAGKLTELRRVRITESRKPDIFTTAGKHYFINGVIRVEAFAHITPMTEEQTEEFFEDHQTLSRDELYDKWQQYAVESNAETDEMIHAQGGKPYK